MYNFNEDNLFEDIENSRNIDIVDNEQLKDIDSCFIVNIIKVIIIENSIIDHVSDEDYNIYNTNAMNYNIDNKDEIIETISNIYCELFEGEYDIIGNFILKYISVGNMYNECIIYSFSNDNSVSDWYNLISRCSCCNLNIYKCGLIIPKSGLIIHLSINKYNLDTANSIINYCLSLPNDSNDNINLTDHNSLQLYGRHIDKNKSVSLSLQKFIKDNFNYSKNEYYKCNIPAHYGIQMFTRDPKSGSGSLKCSDIKRTKSIINKTNIKLFCHDVHIVNIANPNTKLYITIEELKECNMAGFSGVVIHCGKRCKLSKSDAMDIMRDNIYKLLEHATTKCPLILETCVGQGTTLLSSYESFLSFYREFSEHHDKFKICVDTCHVFAAGYNPYNFITNLNQEEPNSISLVHLNGSIDERGSNKDRRCSVLKGELKYSCLKKVIRFCKYNIIPMVTEW